MQMAGVSGVFVVFLHVGMSFYGWRYCLNQTRDLIVFALSRRSLNTLRDNNSQFCLKPVFPTTQNASLSLERLVPSDRPLLCFLEHRILNHSSSTHPLALISSCHAELRFRRSCSRSAPSDGRAR